MAEQGPLPQGHEQWLSEVALAYRDASEALPLMSEDYDEGDLYAIGPNVCFKFRGLALSPAREERVIKAALGSFVATEEESGPFHNPEMAFAFTYVAAHYALDLLEEAQATEVLEYIEAHLEAFRALSGGA